MLLDFDGELNQYKLMSQATIPRPIAWIVTEDIDTNVAPFSFFTPLSSNPPTMIVSIGHKTDGSEKDTLKNIRQTKKCTICLADETQLEKLHFSSAALAFNVSEAKEFDIDLTKEYENFPPRISDAPIAYFCEFYQEVDLKDSKTVPLIVEIKHMYIADEIFSDRDKLYFNYKPIARVGAKYSFLQKLIDAPVMK